LQLPPLPHFHIQPAPADDGMGPASSYTESLEKTQIFQKMPAMPTSWVLDNFIIDLLQLGSS
jgi:hypothetical protein